MEIWRGKKSTMNANLVTFQVYYFSGREKICFFCVVVSLGNFHISRLLLLFLNNNNNKSNFVVFYINIYF